MAKGDQIFVMRALFNLKGVYEHHGIDCGDGTVIHYRKPSETVERTSIATFTQGNPIQKQEYPLQFTFIPEMVVKRAQSRLGEQKYNLLFNNCEHFARWCKTGISQSVQVTEFIPAVVRLNPQELAEPLTQAARGQGDRRNSQVIFNSAIADIKTMWDRLQPKYQTAVREVQTWDRVAKHALAQNREDLARAAIAKKLTHQKQVADLDDKLKRLAAMTKTLITSGKRLQLQVEI